MYEIRVYPYMKYFRKNIFEWNKAIMFRTNLVSRIWRSKELLKFSHYHSSKILKFELSSTHFDSNDYLDSLYSKLRLKDGYSYLDTNLSNQEVICRSVGEFWNCQALSISQSRNLSLSLRDRDRADIKITSHITPLQTF